MTDNTSFINFDPKGGLNCETSTIFLPFNHRITPRSLKTHLEWDAIVEWKGPITLCGTAEKVSREVEWRLKKRRKGITAYEVSMAKLSWRKVVWNWTTFSALTDEDGIVMIFKAIEPIQKMGIQESLKEKARLGTMDECIALEWIPREMIVQKREFS